MRGVRAPVMDSGFRGNDGEGSTGGWARGWVTRTRVMDSRLRGNDGWVGGRVVRMRVVDFPPKAGRRVRRNDGKRVLAPVMGSPPKSGRRRRGNGGWAAGLVVRRRVMDSPPETGRRVRRNDGKECGRS
jgi:hypothetical protein